MATSIMPCYLRWLTECAWAHSAAVGMSEARCVELRRGMAVRSIQLELLAAAYEGRAIAGRQLDQPRGWLASYEAIPTHQSSHCNHLAAGATWILSALISTREGRRGCRPSSAPAMLFPWLQVARELTTVAAKKCPRV